MKIIGNIFDPPIHRQLTAKDPEYHLETSPVLYWIAALYFDKLKSVDHGVWDNTVANSSYPDWNRICVDETFYIMCEATDIEFSVHVHSVGTVFEVWQQDNPWRVVFRMELVPGRVPDYRTIRIDRIDGDPQWVLNYFMLLKLSGQAPAFEVVG